MKRLFLASVMAAAAVGCSPASDKPAAEAAPAEKGDAVEAVPNAPGTVAAQSAGTPSLLAYDRKYPHDAVDGVTFVNHPAVKAIIARSGAPAEALALIAETDLVVTPVRRAGERLLTSGFDPQHGGVDHWAILISADGTKGAVCYSNADGGSDWFADGVKAFTLDGVCPSKPDEIEGLGDWPIGAIPS